MLPQLDAQRLQWGHESALNQDRDNKADPQSMPLVVKEDAVHGAWSGRGSGAITILAESGLTTCPGASNYGEGLEVARQGEGGIAANNRGEINWR